MTEWAWIAAVPLAGCLVGWGLVLRGTYMLFRVPELRSIAAREPQTWPRLSVVIAACNEGSTLVDAARSLLAQDYPDLEVVLVDDRSTDDTGQVVDRLAAAYASVIPVHVRDLPSGWLGKVHALHSGLAQATGAWVLFTDADVHFAPGTLRRAMAVAEAQHLDHLTGIPAAWSVGVVVDTLVVAFLRTFLTVLQPPWGVDRPGSQRFFGVGAFNLVRREAFTGTAGFEWLRMDTADDMGLGLLMKRSGARCLVVTALEDVGLWWHRSLGEVARGLEKGFATLGHCRIWRLLALAFPGLVFDTAPLWGLAAAFLPDPGPLRVMGVGVAVLFVLASTTFSRWSRSSAWPALLTPLLAPLITLLFLRTAWLGWRRRGIAWRGTIYRCRDLRDGRRVRVLL